MKQTTRGRICVDIGRLRVTLFEQARAKGVLPSQLVRSILEESIASHADPSPQPSKKHGPIPLPRVRISLRMRGDEARALRRAAHQAGQDAGRLVADLLAGAPAPFGRLEREARLRALVTSTSELTTISRDVRRLASLLGQGSLAEAKRYRDLLDSVADDIRRHVDIASAILADGQPHRQQPKSQSRSGAAP